MSNPKTLKRFSILYEVVLEAELLDMRRQLALAHEVEHAIVAQKTEEWNALKAGTIALEKSDLLGWNQARVEAIISTWTDDQLNAIRMERRGLFEIAEQRYRASRIKSEQMDKLLEATMRQSVERERRQMQTMSDDRYLSRRRWNELHSSILCEES